MLKNLFAFLAFLLISTAVWFSFYSTQPHNIKTENAPLTEFSTTRAFQHVKVIGRHPHYLGSPAHNQVRNYIVNQLQKMGLEVQTQEGYVLNREGVMLRPQNILSKIEGTGDGDALVLMTHYDSAPHSSYGASDAGSGVATLLEGIRAFLAKNETQKNDIILLFTDAEELGLNGAQLFINKHPWAKNVQLALNFEARGSGGNSFMLLETNNGNASLIRAFKNAQSRYPVTNSLAYSVYKMLPNDTDLTVLREQGHVNGFNFAFIDEHFNYHSANDIPRNLDLKSLAQQGNYLMPLLHYFKDKPLNQLNSQRDLVYFTLPFGILLTYPFSWIVPSLLLAIALFCLILCWGFFQKKLNFKAALRGFLPLLISLLLSGVLVFALWKFCLYTYPQYGEMENGFTYNGYSYIAAAIFLSLCICFITYHQFYKNNTTPAAFIAPLFLWLLLCGLVSFYLKGAAYFIIPAYFGLLQLLYIILQKKPNLVFLAVLTLPSIFILMPFISSFPVALGLKILFVSAVLCTLLFSLLLPVFLYFSQKKLLGILCFITFNVFMLIAHFHSDFTLQRPKPNSLVYLYDANENSAFWYSYDRMADNWTQRYFGESPKISASAEEKFSSKYSSNFTFKAKAPLVELQEPKILIEKLDSTATNVRYSLKIAPAKNSNRLELYAPKTINFEDFSVNSLAMPNVVLGENSFNMASKRWKDRLLTYYISSRDTLKLNFRLAKSKKPKLVLYQSAYSLFENNELNVPARPANTMPRPFVLNDAVIYKKAVQLP